MLRRCPKDTRRGNVPDQPLHITAVRSKVGTNQIEQVLRIAASLVWIRKVIDRLNPRPAKHQPPDAIDDRPVESTVIRMSHPGGKPFSRLPGFRHPFRMKRNRRLDLSIQKRQPVLNQIRWLVFLIVVVFNTDPRNVELAITGRQTFELGLFPIGKGVVVTLGTIDPLTEKGSRRSTRQFVVINDTFRDHRSDKIDFRLVGPQSPIGDHAADNFIVRTVFMKLIAQPGPESVPAKDDELSLVSTHKKPRKPASEIIGEASV